MSPFELQMSARITRSLLAPREGAPSDGSGVPIMTGDVVDTPQGRGRVWGFHKSVGRVLVDVPDRVGLDAVMYENCTVVTP